jgi:hypothetical protein
MTHLSDRIMWLIEAGRSPFSLGARKSQILARYGLARTSAASGNVCAFYQLA